MLDSVRTFELGSALDALDVGVIVIDERRCIVGWNDWIARVSDYSRDFAIGKTMVDLFPLISDTRLPAVIEDSFNFGSSSVLTHSLNTLLPLRGDGGFELLHNVIVRPILSKQASFCLLQINDVTVSVTRERVLRERQNARYRAIVDSAPDAIVTTDADRRIQWVNDAAERVFRFSPGELLGQQIDVLLQDGPLLAAALSESDPGAKKEERTFQVTGCFKAGTFAYFEVSLARWMADERSFVTTIWRDISERRAADLALRESEGRHRALSEALPQLVWVSGADGGCDYFNPQWEDYTGTSAREHFGSGWIDVIHEMDRPKAGEQVGSFLGKRDSLRL